MKHYSDRKVPLAKEGERAAQGNAAALGEIYKAFKALTFYPEGHPLRDEILHRAYKAIADLMQGDGLSLAVHRNGLSFADREAPIENTRMIKALAKELFSREIQRLTLRADMSPEEFTEILSLLSLEPNALVAAGGIARILKEKGTRAALVNEIDIAAVFTRKKVEETSGETSAEGAEVHRQAAPEEDGWTEHPVSPDDPDSLRQPQDFSIVELLALMEGEKSDDKYRKLVRALHVKAGEMLREGEFDALFPILISLLNHNADMTRSESQQAEAFGVFRGLALGEMTEHLLDHLEDELFSKRETVYLILGQLGEEVVDPIFHRAVAADSQPVEKALETALLRIGSPALPELLKKLKDHRLQVVRVAITVLAEMENRDAAKDLALIAYHPDNRIRMETIHALARIGGREATGILIDLLDDENPAIRRQALMWLGISRNEKALQSILALLKGRKISGKHLSLKKEALLALGRIGDRRALEPLFRLVRKRHLFALGRWDELKIQAVETIGQIGGDTAVAFLEKTARRGGCIGRACNAALDNMMQGKSDGKN